MAIILHIDCAQTIASAGISADGRMLVVKTNELQADHAAWIHNAVDTLTKEAEISLNETDAVAVTIGPGSYTGLRVGLATAKGICYALNKPLITINTLKMMANAARNTDATLICPMIDARRMEVFTAIYDKNLTVLKEPEALILNEAVYHDILTTHHVCFCGSGSKKLQTLIQNKNAHFEDHEFGVAAMLTLAEESYHLQAFASLAYSEPLYIKEFHTTARK